MAAPPEGAGLLVISVDGLNPNYVSRADQYGLKIPNLRRIYADGAHATGVRGVLPTVTYPTHTTMLTGVRPAQHGIYLNTTFDPDGTNLAGWYWYSEDIKVPTLWEAAANAGYTVGSVAWPVSVGARGVRYLIPEYWRAMTTKDDVKLLRALSSPGLLAELERVHGEYIIDLDTATPGDWMRTRYAASIISEKRANVLTIHLASLDHIEHATGPGSARAFAALEEIDKMIAVLEKVMRSRATQATLAVVSDHGMAPVENELNLKIAFIEAGLMKAPDGQRGAHAAAVSRWKAQPWSAGGSAAIVVKDDTDDATRKQVAALLASLAANPANGIAAILTKDDIAGFGGSPRASFWVDMKPGFAVGGATSGPLVAKVSLRGTHGYAPTHEEMRAAFLILGPGIRKGADLGEIDIRSVGPTLGSQIGVTLPGAELKALPIAAW